MTKPIPDFMYPRDRFIFYITLSVLTTTCVYPYKGYFGGGQVLKSAASDRYLVSRELTGNDGGIKKVICTEPSPDVATALSALLNSSVKIPGVADVQATASASQAIVQLGKRYAAIQMLRDISYADCQAYANGMLTASQYAALRSRSPQLAVTMLALEMLGGESTEQSWTTSPNNNPEIADTNGAVKPDSGTKDGTKPTNADTENKGASGVYKYNRLSFIKEQAENISRVYEVFAETVGTTPFAVACIGILENAGKISEKPEVCHERGSTLVGCAVSDAVNYCQLYMKWLTSVSGSTQVGKKDAGSDAGSDAGPDAGPGVRKSENLIPVEPYPEERGVYGSTTSGVLALLEPESKLLDCDCTGPGHPPSECDCKEPSGGTTSVVPLDDATKKLDGSKSGEDSAKSKNSEKPESKKTETKVPKIKIPETKMPETRMPETIKPRSEKIQKIPY